MAKRGIKWTKGLSSELSREIRNYNRRVRYFAKKFPQAEVAEPLSVRQAKNTIKTKAQYKKYVSDIGKVRYKTLKEPKKEQKRKPKPKKESKKARQTRLLKEISIDKEPGRFPSDRQKIIRDAGIIEGEQANYDRLRGYVLENKDAIMNWKENYLRGLEKQIELTVMTGNMEAVEQLELLYKKVSKMTALDYLAGQIIYGPELSIQNYYPTRGEGGDTYTARIESIVRVWGGIVG